MARLLRMVSSRAMTRLPARRTIWIDGSRLLAQPSSTISLYPSELMSIK